jgi:hypothetical protein
MNFRLTLRQVMGYYLALALLMVPLLGLMHGVVHDFSHGLPVAVVSANAHRHAQPRASVGQPAQNQVQTQSTAVASPAWVSLRVTHKGWSEALFAGHGKAADCLVFDQLCHADALHFLPLQALSTTLPSIVLVTLAGDFIARWAALFQARGPPSAR